MKDFDYLKDALNEYRLSRPSDISGTKKLSGNDMRSLMTNIKKRVVKGDQRKKLVKDELVKFWKKKGLKSKERILKGFKEGEELEEGGNMFNSANKIHISEVPATLQYLEKIVGLPGLAKNTLGSTGKKEFSGDVDVAIPYKDESEITDMNQKLRDALGPDSVRRQGKMISLLLPIQNFDPSQGEGRTGDVQADLLFTDDPKWLTFFYHSSANSKHKGMHRNIAISALTAELDRRESIQRDDMDRPQWVERWKWSPAAGLGKIKRLSYKNQQTGKWVKKRKDVELEEFTKDPNKIAEILFRGQAGPEALDSLETIVDTVGRVYQKDHAERVYERIAKNITEVHARSDMGVEADSFPEPLQKYLK